MPGSIRTATTPAPERSRDPAGPSSGGRHQEELLRRGRLLDEATTAGRRLAPGAPVDGQEEAARWLCREASVWGAALRAAAAAGDHRRVMEVAEALHWSSGRWAGTGPWEEVFVLGTEAARALGDPRSEAVFLNYAALHHLAGPGRHEQARTCAVAALVCAHRAGDAEQAAWARLHCALALSSTDVGAAASEAGRAAAEFERLRHPEGTLRALAATARALSGVGRHDEARPYLNRLRALCAEPADALPRPLAAATLAWACLLQGEGLAAQGQWEDAERVYRRGLADLEPEAGTGSEVLLCLGLAGVLRRGPAGASQGAALLHRALDVAMEANDVQGVQRVLRALDDWAVIAR